MQESIKFEGELIVETHQSMDMPKSIEKIEDITLYFRVPGHCNDGKAFSVTINKLSIINKPRLQRFSNCKSIEEVLVENHEALCHILEHQNQPEKDWDDYAWV